jgi:hypothetical protein
MMNFPFTPKVVEKNFFNIFIHVLLFLITWCCRPQKPKHVSSNKTDKNVNTVTDGLPFLSAVHISQQNVIS